MAGRGGVVSDVPLPEESNPPHSYRLEIARFSKGWIDSNSDRRLHHYAKARKVKLWRDVTAWRSRGMPTIERCRIVCELRFGDRRKRDPGNWYPTAKACLDGLRDSGVLPDDDAAHVIGPDMRLGPVVHKDFQALVIHIFPMRPETEQ